MINLMVTLKILWKMLVFDQPDGAELMRSFPSKFFSMEIALPKQSNANPSPTSLLSENSPPWESSPIKSIDEALRDTVFGADDMFDKSMFLPNVDVKTDIPQTADCKFLISPVGENKTSKVKPNPNYSYVVQLPKASIVVPLPPYPCLL
jgi:hypothetical protein